MRHALVSIIVFCLFACSAICWAAPVKDPLLERLVGNWVLRGTIAGKQTTHDIVTEWFLDHQYLRIHETSREKNDKGQAQYEAVVLIGWMKWPWNINVLARLHGRRWPYGSRNCTRQAKWRCNPLPFPRA